MKIDLSRMEVVDDAMAEVFRRKHPSERIRIGFEIWMSCRRMLEAHLRRAHPDWRDEAIQREIARRLLHGAL
jgi:hypothetical protein